MAGLSVVYDKDRPLAAQGAFLLALRTSTRHYFFPVFSDDFL